MNALRWLAEFTKWLLRYFTSTKVLLTLEHPCSKRYDRPLHREESDFIHNYNVRRPLLYESCNYSLHTTPPLSCSICILMPSFTLEHMYQWKDFTLIFPVQISAHMSHVTLIACKRHPYACAPYNASFS